ncbi:MAG: nucleoside deaminase [Marinilabiliaceae bacterium]|nr:nucleoside deaminase [Marinilabiliaceae bacterium]
MDTDLHSNYMREAIRLANNNIKNGGGPFGAIIVQDNEIIGRGVNRVTANSDPTAHAEVNAIREAALHLKTFDLSNCSIYTSCEPCPMCLGAIYWARISTIYYGNAKKDAAQIGFDDQFIYDEIKKPLAARKIPTQQLLKLEAISTFSSWAASDDKIEY